MKKTLKLVIISDGTGETARAVVDAAMVQFKNCNTYFTRYKNVMTREQIDAIFDEAGLHHDLILYTIVQSDLREHIERLSRTRYIRALDLLGPVLTAISNCIEQEPQYLPGLLHSVNDNYFNRVEAMEFTLNHDDGRNLESLHLTDIILLGISRTSKTPLSLYLAQHGYKVVNVPLVYGTPLPKELFKADQRKIFGLTINPETLEHIRKNRLLRLNLPPVKSKEGNYADTRSVISELEWAEQIFKENKRWPVFNVTDKAIEETASEIIKIINMRKNNIFKQQK